MVRWVGWARYGVALIFMVGGVVFHGVTMKGLEMAPVASQQSHGYLGSNSQSVR